MSYRFIKLLGLSVFIILIVLWIWLSKRTIDDSDSINIAMVGPVSGSSAVKGQAVLKGINMYLDEVNQKGGINGKKVTLSIFDDKNETTLAKDQAIEIAKINKALIVIGHWYSSCSISASPIYDQYGIPAITPGATNIKVTDSPWYFRTIYNDRSQGRFLANYARKVLGCETATIIYEDLAYGEYLAQVFEETSKEIGLRVTYKQQFKIKDPKLKDVLYGIVKEIKKRKQYKNKKSDPGMLYLSMHADEGITFVKMLKDEGIDNPIIVPDSLSSKQFIYGFNEFPEEKINPGHYSNGIYAISPLIFDTANQKAQEFKERYQRLYMEEPDWIAAYGYDTAMVALQAIKKANISASQETIKDDREKIRVSLNSFNSLTNAIEGITGFNYFDERGDCNKPISIGFFKFQNIVSALTQLKAVPDLNGIINLEKELQEERILIIDNQYMFKTNVVYTGTQINEITEVDMNKLFCDLDFYIWFRYQGDINPEDIQFSNSVDPITLRDPIIEKFIDNIHYRAYRVKARFKADFFSGGYGFRQHVIGFKFNHRQLTRNNLIYVIDVLGMSGSECYLETKKDQENVLSPVYDWSIKNVSFFQDTAYKSALGSPEYLNSQDGYLKFSQFNMGIRIKKNEFTLRGAIPRSMVLNILVLSIILLISLYVSNKLELLKKIQHYIWFVYVVLSCMITLSSEVILFEWLALKTSAYNLRLIIMCFDVLWWVIPAYLIQLALERFIWIPLEKRSGRKIPKNVRRFVAFILYLLATFGIIAFVFNQKLTSLLATSGMVAMIVGLAIQVNISNIFAGIAINLDRPFRTGDWVAIGKFDEGVVVDITWRATRLQTRDGCILSIPNSEASEAAVHNFSYPDGRYWQYFTIHIDPIHMPNRVKKILLDAALSVDTVLKKPEPSTRFLGFNEGITGQSRAWAANYLISVCVTDYGKKFMHNEVIWERVITHLRRAGIEPITQRQEFFMFQGQRPPDPELTGPGVLLYEVDIFKPFFNEAKSYLSSRLKYHKVEKGTTVSEQGDSSCPLYIVYEGVISLKEEKESKEVKEIMRIGVGNYFGEVTMLTGDARILSAVAITDSVLYKITKHDIAPLIEDRPELCAILSNILAQRRVSMVHKINVDRAASIDKEKLAKEFYEKIVTNFKINTSLISENP